MKKVCFFMCTPFDLGGEQRISSVLANYLANNGYDITFLLTSKNHTINRKIYNLDEKIKIVFITEFTSKFYRIKRKVITFFSKLNSYYGFFKHSFFIQRIFYCTSYERKVLNKYLKKYNFDYVIGVGSMYAAKLCIMKELINESSKLIFWQNSSCKAYFETKGARFYNQPRIVSCILQNIDTYIVQTESDKMFLKEKYNYSSTIKINNPNTFKNYIKRNVFPKRFIAAGRLIKLKNFDLLIESFSIFNTVYPDWELYIFGEGPDRKKLEKKIKKYNLEKKIFLPGKSTNMSEEYMKSSIYLMSSLWEGWGMVVTEAMQRGLPILSTDLPSIEEIFGNCECGIITSFSVEDYSNSMINIVKGDKIKKYSDNCVQRVKYFDIDEIGIKWKNVLGGK